MAQRRNDSNELSNTAYSVILIFIGGAVLADTRNLPSEWLFLFIGLGNALLIAGIYLAYRPIRRLRDNHRTLENRIHELEGFFGIISPRPNTVNNNIRQNGSNEIHLDGLDNFLTTYHWELP